MARPKKPTRRSWGALRKLPSGRWQAKYAHGPAAVEYGPADEHGTRKLRAPFYTSPLTFTSQMDAEAWLNDERRLIERGEWTPPAERHAEAQQQHERDRITVRDWLESWLESRAPHLRASTLASYRNEVRARITEVGDPRTAKLADTKLSDLDRQTVGDWWDAISAAYPDTKQRNRHAYVRLRSAMDAAVERELIPANPVVVRAARPKPSTKDKRLPTDDELRAILDHTPDRYRVAVALVLFHALRVGEMLALVRSDVTITRDNDGTPTSGVVRIDRNAQRVTDPDTGHTSMVVQPPKSEAGRRVVPILAEHLDLIAEHVDALPTPDTLVTATSTGETMFDTSFRSVFGRARDRAGVDPAITPHYGRNWLVTRLLERGATPVEVGRICGQRDLRVILETYGRVAENRPGDLMAAVSASLSGTAPALTVVSGDAEDVAAEGGPDSSEVTA